jgi:hypothetical protein
VCQLIRIMAYTVRRHIFLTNRKWQCHESTSIKSTQRIKAACLQTVAAEIKRGEKMELFAVNSQTHYTIISLNHSLYHNFLNHSVEFCQHVCGNRVMRSEKKGNGKTPGCDFEPQIRRNCIKRYVNKSMKTKPETIHELLSVFCNYIFQVEHPET